MFILARSLILGQQLPPASHQIAVHRSISAPEAADGL